MAALGRGQRGTQISAEAEPGLMVQKASGTLNGSSPTANLASINIKGKWVAFHFPDGKFAGCQPIDLQWKSKHIAHVMSVGHGRPRCCMATGEPARLTSLARLSWLPAMPRFQSSLLFAL